MLFQNSVSSKTIGEERKKNMTEQLTRLKETNLPLICRECREEFRGAAAARQHTHDRGHKGFYPKPASFPQEEGTK
jgi:hypothetical protein